MHRIVAVVLVAVLAGSVTGCSSHTTGSSATASNRGAPTFRVRCGPEVPDATYSSTTTAPCIPTTTTTTTSTLPAPVAPGARAQLEVPSTPGAAQVTITVSRIWTGVTPTFTTGPPGGLAHALQFVHAPADLQWIGLAVTMTNTGPQEISMISNGRYQPYLGLVVRGPGTSPTTKTYPDLAQLGFYAGVTGCPPLFPGGEINLAPGSTAVGCLAVPIPSGTTLASIGFSLGNEGVGNATSVALWTP